MKPLGQWICDKCGQVIASPEDAWAEWYLDEKHRAQGFKIVHHSPASPLKPSEDCYHYTNHRRRQDMHLDAFLGQNGLATLLSFLDPGPWALADFAGPEIVDIREFVDFFRRVQVPHYEEARRFWSKAMADGAFESENEVSVYSQSMLKKIISKYGE